MTKIDEFAEFCAGKGYAREPTKGAYEILRLRKEGEPPVTFYQRTGTDHATAQGKGLGLVSSYLASKRKGNTP